MFDVKTHHTQYTEISGMPQAAGYRERCKRSQICVVLFEMYQEHEESGKNFTVDLKL